MDLILPFLSLLSLFNFFPTLLIQVKKVPESRRALAANQAQAPVCLQRPFAVTGLLFEPDALTFLDAALKVLCAILAEGFCQVQNRGKESMNC